MTAEQIRLAIDTVPFRPFTVYMPDGRSASVPHRDFISVHPNGRTLVVHFENGGSRILDTMLVTGIEFRETAA